MSIGAVLVGIAALAVLAAYLARPFRPAPTLGADRMIEAWVARVQAEDVKGQVGPDVAERTRLAAVPPQERLEGALNPVQKEDKDQTVNYCPQCGRRVGKSDRFCSGCGTPLRRGTDEPAS